MEGNKTFDIGSKVYMYSFSGGSLVISSYTVESRRGMDYGRYDYWLRNGRCETGYGYYVSDKASVIDEDRAMFGTIEEAVLAAEIAYESYAFYRRQEIDRLGFDILQVKRKVLGADKGELK